MAKREIIIKDTHRGLWYEDGVLKRVLEAGRYEIPKHIDRPWKRTPVVEVVLVDVRVRDLTIKGQEILTADKVAIRVSIIVQFRVSDPRAAVHEVEKYEDRLYSDVQLAARRSLASMTLEAILTNRNQLSEDILRDVKESASGFGVQIQRADVKDLVFPGNLQEIMNRVLTAERLAEAQLVEARTKAEVQRIDAQAKADARRLESAAQADYDRLAWEAQAEIQRARNEHARRVVESEIETQRLRTEADVSALAARAESAAFYREHPALLRLIELETLREIAKSANARIMVGFDRFARGDDGRSTTDDRS